MPWAHGSVNSSWCLDLMPAGRAGSMMLSWRIIFLALSWTARSNAWAPHPRGTRSGVPEKATLGARHPASDLASLQARRQDASRQDDDDETCRQVNHDRIDWSRRGALKEVSDWGCSACASVLLLVGPSSQQVLVARADDAQVTSGDLTSRMFNPDGSVKEGYESVAQFRTVTIDWDDAPNDGFAFNVDGVDVGSTASGARGGEGTVRITYRLPQKWATGGGGGDELYFDRTVGVNAKACRRITVFRAEGGKASEAQLEKASTVGIAKSLRVPTALALLESADLVSGRTASKDGQRYFDFDMAVAPTTCEQSKENLGLGFCPYESIYLLSATVLDGHLYVMVLESDKDEWKRANSDLKLVRDSFAVFRPSDV